MVQEEISKIMLLIKPQKVISVSVEIIRWFIKLHPEMDIKIIQQFFVNEVKKIVEFRPNFVLVIKYIFDEEKAQKPKNSFINKNDSRLKGIHVEDVKEQALEITSAVRKVIKSDKFKNRYNINVYFSP